MALKPAAREVGGVQIQNAGTVAGNLCNASPAADGVPPLLALDAEVELPRPRGAARLPLERLHHRQPATARRDELVTAIHMPTRSDGARSTFLKLGARRYLVISIVMVAAMIAPDGDGPRRGMPRVAVGACSAVAQRLPGARSALLGRPADAGLGRDRLPPSTRRRSPRSTTSAAAAPTAATRR